MRPSYAQLEALGDFLSQNPGIAKGHLRTAHGKNVTKKKWDKISVSLNALGGIQKDGKEWAKFWAHKKCSLKKWCAQNAMSMKKTGGAGEDTLTALSPLDLRLIDIVGGPDFPKGDGQVADNTVPFIEESQDSTSIIILEESPPYHANMVNVVRDPLQVIRKRSPIRKASRQTAAVSRSEFKEDRNRFEAKESKRIEAENSTEKAFSVEAENMNISSALEKMSSSIREGADAVASALNRIADAIERSILDCT